MNIKIDKASELLEKVSGVSLRFRKNITENLKQDYLQLTQLFEIMSTDERNLFKQNAEKIQSLFGYSGLAAEQAINTSSLEWLRAGLISHIMSGVEVDYRVNILYIHLLNHAATRLGVSIVNVFEQIEYLADVKTRRVLNGALRDDQPLDYIHGNDIEEVEVDGEIQFHNIKSSLTRKTRNTAKA